MATYWQFLAWEKRAGYDMELVMDIMECENPRTLVRRMKSVYTLSEPAEEGDGKRFELRLIKADGTGEELAKWDIVRGATPARCRKPRACIEKDGALVDIERFCFDHLRAMAA